MSKYGTIAVVGIVLTGGVTYAQPGMQPPAPAGAPPGETAPLAPGAATEAAPGAAAMPPDQAPAPEDGFQGGPAPQPRQPPPGSTHVTFLSTTDMPWDVTLDQQMTCTTPCSLWVAPLRFVALHSEERSPVRLDVGYLNGGDITIAAEPLHQGAYATGVTFTALGGMALVTGITLTAVGCSTDRSGMCTAGLITGISGGAVMAGSIWLMTRAIPRAHIGPARPYVAGTQVGMAGRF